MTTNNTTADGKKPIVDFSNTKIAFSNKSDEALKHTAFIFRMMNKSWIVGLGSRLALVALKLRLPFVESIIKSTIFKQFVGGTSLLECTPTIEHLYKHEVLTILDYGAEAKSDDHAFNKTMNECIRAIDFAIANDSTPVISTKITGLARFELLRHIQNGQHLDKEMRKEYRSVLKRIDAICSHAAKKDVKVFFDAEESWIQDAIDHLVILMMKRYNKQKCIVYNTFQMYRKDRLKFLFDSFDLAKLKGFILGAKIVRGAYMNKERARAEEQGYPDPIQVNKRDTDDAYNTAVRFCVDHYKEMASCNASHNEQSALLMAELIAERNIPRNHPNLNFCQLLGMSDQLTFNLANAGYNVAKYMPYGAVKEVIPYLVRRAQENSTVTGDMSREYKMVKKEIDRRGL